MGKIIIQLSEKSDIPDFVCNSKDPKEIIKAQYTAIANKIINTFELELSKSDIPTADEIDFKN